MLALNSKASDSFLSPQGQCKNYIGRTKIAIEKSTGTNTSSLYHIKKPQMAVE